VKKLLALGTTALALTGCLGATVDGLVITNLRAPKNVCTTDKKLELSFDYVGGVDVLELTFIPNGKALQTFTVDLDNVPTGFTAPRAGQGNNLVYTMKIDLNTLVSSPTPKAPVGTAAVTPPNALTIYPMDVQLVATKRGVGNSSKLEVNNINVQGCYIDTFQAPLGITKASFMSGFSNTSETEYYACGTKDTPVEVNFNWVGNLKEYAIELYGKNNPTPSGSNTYPRYPATGYFQPTASEITAKQAVKQFIYGKDEVHPLRIGATTQAVTVVPVPNPVFAGDDLGATKVRIVARDVDGNTFTYNVAGEIKILGNQTQQCQ
jgi:hypothetical protein